MKLQKMNRDECSRIKEIDASQYIKNAWREIDGERKLVKIDYFDPDWPNGFEEHLERLEKTIDEGGIVIGAYTSERLVGIASVNRSQFGSRNKYILLDQLFITKDHRNQGIGKRLFVEAAEIAKDWDATKLYICAGSAEETIAFYRAIGCSDAEEIDQKLYDDDPRDMHLEFDLYRE